MGYNTREPTEKQLFIIAEDNGFSAFVHWYQSLIDLTVRARIRARLVRVQAGNLGDCESLGSGVHELRMFFGPGYRVYFALRGDAIVILLYGGDKASQKKDVKEAKKIWRDFRNETTKLRRFSC